MSLLSDLFRELRITGVASIIANLLWLSAGVIVKALIDVVINRRKRDKLSTILGCAKRDEVTLYIPARRGSVIAGSENYLVITEESLVISDMQRFAEELSVNITISQAAKDEEIYDGRTSGWFIGGFLVHNYILRFFVDVMKEYVRFSCGSLENHREDERCLYFEYPGPRQIFIWYGGSTKNRLDKLLKRLKKSSSWDVKEGLSAPDGRQYLSFQLKDNEKYFFLIKFINNRGNGVFVCLGATAETNHKLVRMIREERTWLFHKVKHHRNGYLLMGKNDEHRDDICLNDIIDLTWIIGDELKRIGI